VVIQIDTCLSFVIGALLARVVDTYGFKYAVCAGVIAILSYISGFYSAKNWFEVKEQ